MRMIDYHLSPITIFYYAIVHFFFDNTQTPILVSPADLSTLLGRADIAEENILHKVTLSRYVIALLFHRVVCPISKTVSVNKTASN